MYSTIVVGTFTCIKLVSVWTTVTSAPETVLISVTGHNEVEVS